MSKKQPRLGECFHCGKPVHEFNDDQFGCDGCKSVWVYNGHGWRDITRHPLTDSTAFRLTEEDDEDIEPVS